MKAELTEVEINGTTYVPKSATQQMAQDTDGKQAVLIRTFSAGVHFGYLARREGKEVELLNARRVHYWNGAASLSQMAAEGVSKPKDCRFSVMVASIILTEAIEIIPLTLAAKDNLYKVPVWKA